MSKNLLKSGSTVVIMTILSRVTGLLREMVFANIFGATAGMDAFLAAFRIPNFMRRLFAEGAFSQAFVPTLSEYRQTRSHQEVKDFIGNVAGMLSLVLFVVTVIATILAPIFVIIFTPGFIHDPSRFALTSAMLRVTFPYLFFISLTACAGAVLNSYDRFGVPAFTPVLLNLSMIGTAIFLAPYFKEPVYAAAWGVFLGGVAQLLFQLPFLQKLKLLPKLHINWHDEGVRRVVRLMVPAILGVSMAQIGLFIDMLFASFLREGSITWLYFSDRMSNFPLGVFGVAIATVILPHLSRKHAAKSQQEYSAALDWALRSILLIGIPCAIGILILSGPILSTFLQHGKFNAFAVQMATKSLMAFSVGLPSFMLVKILAAGFYSKQDIKTPVRIAVIATILNILSNCILIFPLAHAGLALSTSLASSFNASYLFYLLRKREIYTAQKGWIKYFWQLGFANVAMIAALLLTSPKLSVWLAWAPGKRVVHLGIAIAAAGIVYLGCLLATGVRWHNFKLQQS
jgi:putative peptidoglycan lipid II flippase